jgi:hypothetical protein
MSLAVIFDIDGTLLDTNYQHALAWYQAFRHQDLVKPIWRIHRAIGIGSDRVVEMLAGEQVEQDLGETLRDAQGRQCRLHESGGTSPACLTRVPASASSRPGPEAVAPSRWLLGRQTGSPLTSLTPGGSRPSEAISQIRGLDLDDFSWANAIVRGCVARRDRPVAVALARPSAFSKAKRSPTWCLRCARSGTFYRAASSSAVTRERAL